MILPIVAVELVEFLLRLVPVERWDDSSAGRLTEARIAMSTSGTVVWDLATVDGGIPADFTATGTVVGAGMVVSVFTAGEAIAGAL